MVTSVSEGRPRLRSDLIPSLLALSSHADSSLSIPATHSLGLLCGGSLSCVEVEGVLSSGIVERLCTRIESGSEDESESGSVDVLPTLVVLDRLCSGLRSHIDSEQHSKSNDKKNEEWREDSFSLTRRCGFALARIEKAVLTLGHSLGGRGADERTHQLQEKVGGIAFRHFSSSIPSPSQKEIGAFGIDLAAVRREMEEKMKQMEEEREKDKKEREKEKREMEMREKEREMAVKKAEEERQREFSRKMREMEEMKRMNEKWIEEGRQREEEKKREEERKRKEEEERRRNVKEGAAAIEVFQQDKFTLAGNVFTKTCGRSYHSLLSHSFGVGVVRITFIIRAINGSFCFGLISTDLTEQTTTGQKWFMSLIGGAGWNCHSNCRYSEQNGKESHDGSACKAGAVGQRVVMEADGREGKRTLKLSQDGETQPVFFSNIPVPFRFGLFMYESGASVEIVSTEVLQEPSLVGGSLEVVMD
ncbi:hypothetical protein BLNAU_11225 [Blattamonas nauphoetae]|uniref:Uncharacterized protein n=1 Tax=Blattamonas nauphoetae TaxID=2049346 RepID=A0ABQ9XQV1_9EUKA|nr:hypothetical protein BLNAU_11225 [Blattamonas nauphoetae]